MKSVLCRLAILALALGLVMGCSSSSKKEQNTPDGGTDGAADGATDADADADGDGDTDTDTDTDGDGDGDAAADANPDDPALAAIIGKPCTPSGADAGNDPGTCTQLPGYKDSMHVICFGWSNAPDKGFCTITDCKNKYSDGGVDTCPGDNNYCVDISPVTSDTSDDATGNYLCAQRCDLVDKNAANTTCPAGFACNPYLGVGTNAEMVPTCVMPACTGPSDCGLNTGKACNPQNANADCDEGAGETCEQTDATDVTIGSCYKPGVCYTSGICGNPGGSKKVGEPCTADDECPTDGMCMTEFTETTNGKLVARNGYCTKGGCLGEAKQDYLKCPTGSACNRAYSLGGLCQHVCTQADATSCRQALWTGTVADKNADYECYMYGGLGFLIDGVQVKLADSPVCDMVFQFTCSLVAGMGTPSMPAKCRMLGLSTSEMICRTEDGTSHETDYSVPKTYCLDKTTSGPTGYWPGGGPDAGF